MERPTRSLPVSLMKDALMPQRPSEMRLLNTDPPGTALTGWSFLKMMSRTVSPIPMTLRFMLTEIFCKIKKKNLKSMLFLLFFPNFAPLTYN